MVILWIEVAIAICLIVVEIVMLQRMKKRNENWWRTYWAKDKLMMDKIKEIDEKIAKIMECEGYDPLPF